MIPRDPPVGRWYTPDPLGGDTMNPQSLNRYAYVENNPTTYVDPSGLFRHLPFGCVGDGTGFGMICPGDISPFPSVYFPVLPPGVGGRGSVGGGGAPKPAPPAPKPNIIHWPQLQKLVHENDESLFGCDELIDCIIFKESSRSGGFNANAVPLNRHGEPIRGATARGLMEVTLGAAADVAGAPPGSAAAVSLHDQLFNPATNIQTGSRYLDILYVRFGGWPGALARYGTGPGYADDVLNCVEDLFLGNVPGAMEDARGGP